MVGSPFHVAATSSNRQCPPSMDLWPARPADWLGEVLGGLSTRSKRIVAAGATKVALQFGA